MSLTKSAKTAFGSSILFALQKMKAIPRISETERIALDAGTAVWDKELLSGKPNWDILHSLKPELTDEEQAFLDGPVNELCELIDDWQISRSEDGDLPPHIWDFIKKNKFLGMVIPKDHGGLGFTAYAHSQVVMKLASRSITAAVSVMVPNSLGPGELLHLYGTDEQKHHYLPRLADGREIPCFALTGPDNGSDATSMEECAYAVVEKDAEGNLQLRMNWEKRYITLGPIATLVGMAVHVSDPDGLLQGTGQEGLTTVLIPHNTPGVTIGDRHRPLDLAFHNGPNWGKDVVVPIDYVIGGQEKVGHGWRMLGECLSVGRSISLPALSTAASKLSSMTTGAYTEVRQQFKSKISQFEGIEEPLARIAGKTYTLDAMRTASARMVDRGERPTIISAIAKYHATEKMRSVIDDAMDIHGGKGICNGPNNYLAEVYKSIPVAITVEGANIMTRNLIIFGQGGVRAHEYLLDIVRATENPDKEQGARDLIKPTLGFVGSIMANLWRSMTGFNLAKIPSTDKALKKHYKKINHMSARFNFAANMSIIFLGDKLKFKERTSARLGDVLSNLYMASAALNHYQNQGSHSEDLALVNWVVENCMHDAEVAMNDLAKNHPNPLVKGLLRVVNSVVTLTGRSNRKPNDKLDHEVAKTITTPGATRDRLVSGLFVSKDKADILNILERAFVAAQESGDAERKVAKAVHKGFIANKNDLQTAVTKEIITADEAQKIETAATLRRQVIMVDDFKSYKREDLEPNKREHNLDRKPKPAA